MFSRAWTFSPINLFFQVWSDFLTYAFLRMSLFTYEFTFTRMDWLSQLCFLTHDSFDLWIYLLTYGLTFSHMFSHAWAFAPMNLPSHVWSDSLTSAFWCMSLFTYESTFSRMDWLSHLCFPTHDRSHQWIYLLTYGLTLSPMILDTWAWIDFRRYALIARMHW